MGHSYDIHALVSGRKLILSGVNIPFDRGLAGHSDADVVFHAVADALLGALAFGDIGTFFPDTSPEWKNVDSAKILTAVTQKVRAELYDISNVDVTLVAERPKLLPFMPEMKQRLAAVLGVHLNQVSLKARTNEKLGALGREEGIAAWATVLVEARS